jgi:hypothetical protein
VVVVAVLFWARISLLTRLVACVFTLVVALLWFYFICFDFFSKLRGRFVVGEHFIILGLDIPLGVPSNCFCLLCFGGCFSYLFGFNCFVFAYFQKKKNIMGCFSQYLRLLGHCLFGFVVSFAHGMLLS